MTTGQKEGLGASDYDTALLTTRVVEAGDIDELGHVNNTVYLRWVQDAAVNHWNMVASDALKEASIFIVLRHEIDYRDAAELGDTVEIRTWLGKASGPRFDRFVDIRKAGANRFSARARTTWCMLDKNTRRPMRVSDDVIEMFGLDAGAHR